MSCRRRSRFRTGWTVDRRCKDVISGKGAKCGFQSVVNTRSQPLYRENLSERSYICSLNEDSTSCPHNAPGYRRRVHDKVRYFSSDEAAIAASGEDRAPTCFDWRFWVRVASEGGRFYGDAPLKVYYVRLDSHGRRDKRSSDACIRSVFQTARTSGLYNNAHSRFVQQRALLAI